MVNEIGDNHDIWEQNSVRTGLIYHQWISIISSTIIDCGLILSVTWGDLVAPSGGIAKIC